MAPLTVIVGFGINTKPVLVAMPPGLVTVMLPLVPSPTTASMVVLSITLKEAASVPPKATAVAAIKLLPIIVTVLPVPALAGEKEVMVQV